jgi:hypothetical protein
MVLIIIFNNIKTYKPFGLDVFFEKLQRALHHHFTVEQEEVVIYEKNQIYVT